jgi:hypothetical protein
MRAFWSRVETARRSGLRVRSTRTSSDFAAHFAEIHADDDSLLAVVNAVTTRLNAYSTRTVISPTEVEALVRRLKRGTSPSPVHVTVEHILYGLCPELLTSLALLLTSCIQSNVVLSSFASSSS